MVHFGTYLSHSIFLFIYQVRLFAPASSLSQCSRLTKNWSLGFTEETVSQFSFNTMEGRRGEKNSSKASNWNHAGKTRQKGHRRKQKAWEVYEKGSRDEQRQASQPCSWVPAFINTNWKQSKYIGEKGLQGVDIKNHPLHWQPSMQRQHQP